MIGRTISHYTITAELGSGAMGQVWLARDERTDRRVALKFLTTRAGGDQARERLLREARAAARLSHPGIVALYAIEESGAQLFLVEEYVEGETLAHRLARGPLGPPEALRLARELTGALAHAHRNGVLHRDLKPENVLIAADGSFKIADFGIARIEGAPQLTTTGVLLGTLPYLAPERLSGAAGDARADLFALGAILYEAIGGHRAFPGASEAEVMYAVLNEEPAPLAPVSPRLRPLAALAAKLLAKEPSQRPASAEAVAGMLEGMEAGAAATPAARHRTVRWIVPVAAALLVVLTAGAWWLRQRAAAPGPGESSIAVLYFENVSDPEDHGRMGRITGNLLITSIAQSPGMDVLSTQRILDAMRRLGRRGTVDRDAALEVAKRARAGRIVTGSILQTEPAIVMTAEVSDVRSGRVLDAARIEGTPGQTVFQVVDALSARLMQKLARPDQATRLLPVAQRTSADLEAQRAYAEGLDHLAAGEFDAAQGALRDAVRRDPRFAQAYYQLAIAEWWNFETRGSTEDVARADALADRLSSLERGVLAGIGALVASDWSRADSIFARLARDHPDEKLVRYGLMEAAYHSGDCGRTIEAARAALALDPNFTLVGHHLADALEITGRGPEAERLVDELLRRSPGNVFLWRMAFALHVRLGDADGAMAAARAARAAGVRGGLGAAPAILLVMRDSLAAAREWLAREDAARQPWERDPEGADYYDALRRGRFRMAIAIVRRAWARTPRGPATQTIGAGGFFAAVGARDSSALKAFCDNLRARFMAAGTTSGALGVSGDEAVGYARMGHLARARTLLARLAAQPLAETPGESRLLDWARAEILLASGRGQEALPLLDRAVFFMPGYAIWTPRLARARALAAAGSTIRALGILDTLLQAPVLSPDEGVHARFERARLLEKLGRPAAAIADYREFLRLWKDADPGTPELPLARAALARLERARQSTPRPEG